MTGGSSGHEGGRALKTRVRTARKRSLASTLWLERQLNDPFVAQAKREGYRSRAAYKLIEMAEKYALFRPDSASSISAPRRRLEPGGGAEVKAAEGEGRVVAIDILPMDAIVGVEFELMDFHADDAPERLRARLGGLADGVMSDMAATPPATARPTICASSGSPSSPSISPARCWRRAASLSPRCCRADRRANCWRG